jgi:hypothetical protein
MWQPCSTNLDEGVDLVERVLDPDPWQARLDPPLDQVAAAVHSEATSRPLGLTPPTSDAYDNRSPNEIAFS